MVDASLNALATHPWCGAVSRPTKPRHLDRDGEPAVALCYESPGAIPGRFPHNRLWMRHARANQGFRVWEPLTMRYGSSTFTHTETSKSYCSFPSALLSLLFFLCIFTSWTPAQRTDPRLLTFGGNYIASSHTSQFTYGMDLFPK